MNSTMRIQVLASIAFFASMVVSGFVPEHSATYYEATRPEVRDAQQYCAEAKIDFVVVDDEGKPVSTANVKATWQNDYPRKVWATSYVTDGDGHFTAAAKVGHSLVCSVRKNGYYWSSTAIKFDWRPGVAPLVKDGKWQPYGEMRTIILKRKKNPVEMRWHNSVLRAPVTNEWVALDLEKGLWCKPYGEGKCEDVMVRFSGDVVDDFTWDTITEITFKNVPYAGFYELPKDGYSEMKSCYSASTNDVSYARQTIVFTSKGTKAMPPNRQTADRLAENKYLVFRTRCVVDDNNKLVSAHYGKICGEMTGGRLKLMFHGVERGIFFNPKPNDPTLEDAADVERRRLFGRE